MRRRSVLAALAIAAGLARATAVAVGSGPDAGAVAIGADAGRAIAAALVLTGGGRVGAVERDTELGATWEVEVTRPDGSTVDVRLTDDYGVVRIVEDRDGRARWPRQAGTAGGGPAAHRPPARGDPESGSGPASGTE